jgi:hypothetical protein
MEEVNKTYSRLKNCGQVTPGMKKGNNDKREREREREREGDNGYIERGNCGSRREQKNEVEGGGGV